MTAIKMANNATFKDFKTLTDWPWEIGMQFWSSNFQTDLVIGISYDFPDECHWTLRMISQHWVR